VPTLLALTFNPDFQLDKGEKHEKLQRQGGCHHRCHQDFFLHCTPVLAMDEYRLSFFLKKGGQYEL